MKQITFLIFLILQSVSLCYAQPGLKDAGSIAYSDCINVMVNIVDKGDVDGILNYGATSFQLELANRYRAAGVPIVYKEDLIDALHASYLAEDKFKAGEVKISCSQNPDGSFNYRAFRANINGEQFLHAATGGMIGSARCFNFTDDLRAPKGSQKLHLWQRHQVVLLTFLLTPVITTAIITVTILPTRTPQLVWLARIITPNAAY